MVSVKEYKPNNSEYLDKQTVKDSNTKIAVILPGSGVNEFTNTDESGEEVTVQKPYVNVELDGEQYEWTLNKTTAQRLSEEFGSNETDDWIGRQVKLMIDKRGSTEYVTATGLPQQTGD